MQALFAWDVDAISVYRYFMPSESDDQIPSPSWLTQTESHGIVIYELLSDKGGGESVTRLRLMPGGVVSIHVTMANCAGNAIIRYALHVRFRFVPVTSRYLLLTRPQHVLHATGFAVSCFFSWTLSSSSHARPWLLSQPIARTMLVMS